MKISEISKIILALEETNKKFLILGPPGIGKTETVINIAKELANKYRKKFVEYRNDPEFISEVLAHPEQYFVLFRVPLTEMEPSDIGGIPIIEQPYYKVSLPAWLYMATFQSSFLEYITVR